MHARFSTTLHLPVVDDDVVEELGRINGVLIHPDTGKVEGFFLRTHGFFRRQNLFLATEDIQRWGLRITVRGPEVLAPVEERVRLQTLLEEGRYVLGQRVVTETGRTLGRCADVQFETEFFMVEWLLIRKFWRWRTSLPLSQILEVRKDAVVVRDPLSPVPEKAKEEKSPMLQVPEAA
ncbi:MAG: PRC-barrel domain-containing protein [Candidatus Peribacteraceae bacterium]|jgi:uncharacterized protein YrrD